MSKIAHVSESQGKNNEDFSYATEVARKNVLVVGDFARSDFPGIGKLAEKELSSLLASQALEALPPPLMLTQLATQFNTRLLAYKSGYNVSFQCCVIFATVADAEMHYLAVGDCRVAVQRGGQLLLLCGSVWLDADGNTLPIAVAPGQQMKRGREEEPSQVLGVSAVNITPAQVEKLALQTDDTVLLYSDGVDKALSPAQLLDIVSEQPADAGPDELASRIIEQVRLNHGDDDRTVLVVSRPHVSDEGASSVAERQEVVETIKQITQGLGQLTGRLDLLETLVERSGEVSEKLDGVRTSLSDLPAAGSIQTMLTSAGGAQLGEVKGYLSQLQESLEARISGVEAAVKDSAGQHAAPGNDLKGAQLEAEIAELKGLMSNSVKAVEAIEESARKIHETLKSSDERIFNKLDGFEKAYTADRAAKVSTNGEDPAPVRQESPANVVAETRQPAGPTDDSGHAPAGSQEAAEQAEPKRPATPSHQPEPKAAKPSGAGFIQLLDGQSRIHEGVVWVSGQGLELIDEARVTWPIQNPKDLRNGAFLVAGVGAPAGWLTTWYLSMRERQGLYHKLTPKEIARRLLEEPVAHLLKLDKDSMLRLRDEHYRLRRDYLELELRNRPHGRLQPKDLRERELSKQLNRLLEKVKDEEHPQPTDASDSNAKVWPRIKRWLGGLTETRKFRTQLIIGGVVFILTAVLVGGAWWWWSQKSNPSPATNQQSAGSAGRMTDTTEPTAQVSTQQADSWRVAFGATGRTLYLTKGTTVIPLGLRISTGKEKEFQEASDKKNFNTPADARQWINVDKKADVLPLSTIKAEQGTVVLNVTADDLGDGKCGKLVERANRSLGAATTIEDLTARNPRLNCEALLAQDQLMATAKAAAAPRSR